ncbi:MAG TPA: acetoacetate decarboxylase family protein [Gemmatimonadaceae bacterium]|nr:acetoacetate decarboxylase family protein [Gemmatimonadaceae bacterium]
MSSTSSELVQYIFRDCVAGFFEFPTENARAILPAELQPVEPHHGQSVLSIMAFDFTQSMVGAYKELILGVLVSPRIGPGTQMPRSAFYPFLLGTTTQSSREHAIERWHLPHYMRDIDMTMTRNDGDIVVTCADGAGPILELSVTEYDWRRVSHPYQCFMADEDGFYTSTILMEGEFSENEEERGSLVLHPHEMTSSLDLDAVTLTPFREQWMRDGVQTFQPLEQLASYARR